MNSACYFMTRNIYHKVIPSLKSLLCHNPNTKVYLFIEDDEIGFYLPPNVECVNVSGQTFFPPTNPNMGCRWTYMVMMKVVLCYLLPNLDRIISLDCDTIIDGDISELWEIDLGDNYFAGCEEIHRSFPTPHYFNAGVLMWNLKQMRDGKADEVVERLNRERFTFVEQDCLNKLCQGRILEIPSKYNVNIFTKFTSEWVIYHFASQRNWYEVVPMVQQYKDMEWSVKDGSV